MFSLCLNKNLIDLMTYNGQFRTFKIRCFLAVSEHLLTDSERPAEQRNSTVFWLKRLFVKFYDANR